MGTFKNKVLGDVKGKVGEVIGRRRGKKYFIYAAPKGVRISFSPESIQSRNKMKTAAQFASIVNSIPELKYFWAKLKLDAFDAFHKIEKVNYSYFTAERPTTGNTIIPDINSDDRVQESVISPQGIKLKIYISKIVESELDRAKELTGIGVICYYNPGNKENDYFYLSKIRTGTIEVKIDEGFEVEIPFSGEERGNYNSYSNSILYFTMISKNIAGEPIKYCCNYRNEFTHESIGERERFSIRDSQP